LPAGAGMFPRLGYARVWGKRTAALAGMTVPAPSGKALRDLRRRIGPAPPKALFEVVPERSGATPAKDTRAQARPQALSVADLAAAAQVRRPSSERPSGHRPPAMSPEGVSAATGKSGNRWHADALVQAVDEIMKEIRRRRCTPGCHRVREQRQQAGTPRPIAAVAATAAAVCPRGKGIASGSPADACRRGCIAVHVHHIGEVGAGQAAGHGPCVEP